jgi:hypothetical protein
MEQPDTDVKVDNSSIEVSVASKGPTCEKNNSSDLVNSSSKVNPSIIYNPKTSHVSPLEVIQRKFSIGGRSKSMSESLPFTPRNNNSKCKVYDRDGRSYETGRNCSTPKRLQHQRNVKIDDDDDDEDLVFDYSNLSFSSTSSRTVRHVKVPKCQITTRNQGDNNKSLETSHDITRERQNTTTVGSNCSCYQRKLSLCECQHGLNEGVNALICDDEDDNSTNTLINTASNIKAATPSKPKCSETGNTQSSMGVFSSIQPSTPSAPNYKQNIIFTPSIIDTVTTSSTPSHLPPSTELPSTKLDKQSGVSANLSFCNRPDYLKPNIDTNRDSPGAPSTSTTCSMPCSTTTSPSKSTPLRVGFYEIEKTIGRGNFAVVKLARHRITKTEVSDDIVF